MLFVLHFILNKHIKNIIVDISIVIVMYADSPVDVDVDSIFKRKSTTDGVVMEILHPLIVITEEKTD